MKRLRFGAWMSAMLLVFISQAQTLLPRQNEKGKWGYVTEDGKKVIDYKFDQAYDFEDGRAKVQKNKKWGYISLEGKEIIKIQYTEMMPWSDGRCKVAVGGNFKDGNLQGAKWGYISNDGKYLLKPEYDKIAAFEDGLAYVVKNKKYGYINERLETVVKCEYTAVGKFNPEGYCWVASGGKLAGNVVKGAKYGVVKRDGTFVIQPKYPHIGTFVHDIPESNPIYAKLFNSPAARERYKQMAKEAGKGMGKKTFAASFTNSMADVQDEAMKKARGMANAFVKEMEGTLSPQDSMLLAETPSWDLMGYELIEEKPFSKLDMSKSRYYAVSRKAILSDKNAPWMISLRASDQIGILDPDGKEIVKPSAYGVSFLPTEGLVPVAKPSKNAIEINYLLPSGKLLLKKWAKTTGIAPFVNHVAVIPGVDGQYLINDKGEKISGEYSLLFPQSNGNHLVKGQSGFGLIDGTGSELVAPTYNVILPEKDGLYCAQESKDGKYGYIDLKGQYRISPSYTDARSFDSGTAVVYDGKGWGVIDKDAKCIVPHRWEDALSVSAYSPSLCWVKKDGLWQAVSLSGLSTAFDGKFHGVDNFTDEGIAIVSNSDGRYGCIDQKGVLIVPMRLNDKDMVRSCLADMRSAGTAQLSEIDAYRYNIRNNPARNSFRLSHSIENNLWEY